MGMTPSPFLLSCPSQICVHTSTHVSKPMSAHICTQVYVHTHNPRRPAQGCLQRLCPGLSIFIPVPVIGDKEKRRKISGIWGKKGEVQAMGGFGGKLYSFKGIKEHLYRAANTEEAA